MASEIIVQHQQLEYNAEENISKSSNIYDVSVQNMAPNMDALQILEPVRQKLASIEAERIISVIEKTIDKIEIVTLIPYIINNLDRFSVGLGLELTCALREHDRLEKHLDFAFSRLFNVNIPAEASENSIHKIKMEEKKQDIQILQQAFGTSVKNILRLFKGNPSACQIIQSECHARSRTCVDLILVLMELRDFVFERLLIPPNEAKEKFEYVQKIIKRDKQNTEITATLEAELTQAIQNKENERKYKIETEIENWIQKYDADLQEKQDEYENLFKKYNDETVLLFELEQKIGTLEPEYTQIVEERKIKEEKKKAKEHQTFLMGKAAITIQSFWKGYKVRQLMKALKKKKKGKGKKKK
ncbi:dynein regulatory complex protein 10 isoform X2 [Stegostoma tigrinum]|uniref:dynein regulatory complex protein 10 isoform X2 n=1 Tax=Stegostoma tigrinum TaxID=3053191 RepID=UPI0028703609|nr:dynein regulatory complex protein 10 isoform X2 [Stegostoma tigrinum]